METETRILMAIIAVTAIVVCLNHVIEMFNDRSMFKCRDHYWVKEYNKVLSQNKGLLDRLSLMETDINQILADKDMLIKTNFELRECRKKSLDHFIHWYGKGKRFKELKGIMDGVK